MGTDFLPGIAYESVTRSMIRVHPPPFGARRLVADACGIAEFRALKQNRIATVDDMCQEEKDKAVANRLMKLYRLPLYNDGSFIPLIEKLNQLDRSVRRDMVALNNSPKADMNNIGCGFFATRPTMSETAHYCSESDIAKNQAQRYATGATDPSHYVPSDLRKRFEASVQAFPTLKSNHRGIRAAFEKCNRALIYLGNVQCMSEVPKAMEEAIHHVKSTSNKLAIQYRESNIKTVEPWDEIIN